VRQAKGRDPRNRLRTEELSKSVGALRHKAQNFLQECFSALKEYNTEQGSSEEENQRCGSNKNQRQLSGTPASRTQSAAPNQRPSSCCKNRSGNMKSNEGEINSTHKLQNKFSLNNHIITINPWSSSSSPHLIIRIKNKLLAHFYSKKYEMKNRK
jgi:hypothetical protein